MQLWSNRPKILTLCLPMRLFCLSCAVMSITPIGSTLYFDRENVPKLAVKLFLHTNVGIGGKGNQNLSL